jgi:hypothetical protein
MPVKAAPVSLMNLSSLSFLIHELDVFTIICQRCLSFLFAFYGLMPDGRSITIFMPARFTAEGGKNCRCDKSPVKSGRAGVERAWF